MSALASLVLEEIRADPQTRAEWRAVLALDDDGHATAPAASAAYTCRTLAAELGVTPRAIRGAIARGELAARRTGRGWLIGADQVRAWTAPSRTTAPTPRRRRRRARGGLAAALRDVGEA